MPSKSPRTAAIAVAAAGLLALLAYEYSGPTGEPAAPVPPSPLIAEPAPRVPPFVRAPARVAAPPVVLTPEDHGFAEKLRDKFGPHIQSKHAQIKLIEQVIAYLQAHYQAHWRDYARALFAELFPELAEALDAKLDALVQYDDYLRENRDGLSVLPAAQRREALWAARRAAFGADADEIWAGEVRSQKVEDALAAIGEVDGRTLHEKVAQLRDSVRSAYGDQSDQVIAERRAELINAFLDAKAVQQDLAALTPAAQHEALQDIRAGLGMDQDALQRWSELDQQRNQGWDAGQQYAQARAEIIARYEGSEQAQRLTALQDQLLGTEADIIRAEEAAGFFRYAHPRRIGRE